MTARFDISAWDEANSHFYVDVPVRSGTVTIGEFFGETRHREIDRCRLPIETWRQIRKPVELSFRRQIRDAGKTLDDARFATGRNLLNHRYGKQLLVLAWSVESGGDVEAAIAKWSDLAPYELPWLYRQVVEQGNALDDSDQVGWRYALKLALRAIADEERAAA